jgi:two-component system response regulator HydG
MRRLIDNPWPGNVRELENSIEHAVVLAKGDQIELSDLPTAILEARPCESDPSLTIVETEKRVIRKALEDNDWNKAEAARKLGISRSTLYEKLKKMRIVTPPSH